MSPRPEVPTPDQVGERWMRNVLVSALTRIDAELRRIGSNLDHLHDDAKALRERADIPRPECYEAGARPRARRRRARQPQPPGPPAPGETFPTEPGGASDG